MRKNQEVKSEGAGWGEDIEIMTIDIVRLKEYNENIIK